MNHDTLDNRKQNLKRKSTSENAMNRKGKNKNNKSGYRNVFWETRSHKWVVSLCINNNRMRLGEFDDVDKAGQFAKQMRQKYYHLSA